MRLCVKSYVSSWLTGPRRVTVRTRRHSIARTPRHHFDRTQEEHQSHHHIQHVGPPSNRFTHASAHTGACCPFYSFPHDSTMDPTLRRRDSCRRTHPATRLLCSLVLVVLHVLLFPSSSQLQQTKRLLWRNQHLDPAACLAESTRSLQNSRSFDPNPVPVDPDSAFSRVVCYHGRRCCAFPRLPGPRYRVAGCLGNGTQRERLRFHSHETTNY